jgi:cysteinyl-tRNA synthetase
MRLYDSATRGVQKLPPPPGPIGMYFCGPTVYARAHIGNARPFIVGMWLRSWLRHRGYDATLVHNITDINDKIYAASPGRSAELANEATGWYLEDTGGFGLGRPDHEPLASESIPEILALIEELVARGLAYQAGGDVYYRVHKFADYGRLAGRHEDEAPRNPSEEEEQSSMKEDPRDFVLWKAHKEGEDTWWDSPWGRGRPGWHIECSAMAEKFLGPSFEIHGGGLDLIFPHHENEVAQSRGAGREFAHVWTHNGMLRFTGEKMSKSAGNVVTMRDALDEWGRDTLLVYFMGAHWRKPIDYSEGPLQSARAQAEGFRNVFRDGSRLAPEGSWRRFEEALDDDFNTPEALALMHQWRDHELLLRALELFGLGSLAQGDDAPAELASLAERRQQARAQRDFEEADRLRERVEQAGWEVRDVADPPGYRLVRRQ